MKEIRSDFVCMIKAVIQLWIIVFFVVNLTKGNNCGMGLGYRCYYWFSIDHGSFREILTISIKEKLDENRKKS